MKAAMFSMVLLSLFFPSLAQEQPPSNPVSCLPDPSDELEVPTSTPIKHEEFWLGERELFGYAPSFVPNVVSFNSDNEPVMRDGFIVQRLDKVQCAWQTTDLKPVIQAFYRDWDGQVTDENLYFYNRQQRVVFDDDGDAYTHIPSGPNSNGGDGWDDIPRSLLMHYQAATQTWTPYELPEGYKLARLQFRDAYTDLSHPPAVMLGDINPPNDDKVAVVFPVKNPDGTLTIPSETILDSNAFHQGGGYAANFAVSALGKTWIVWGSGLDADKTLIRASCPNPPANESDLHGVPTWIIEYDHLTGTFSQPVCLGFAGELPSIENDNHSIPGITIAGDGILHVVLGAHNRRFKYTSSTAPWDISGWSDLEFLGAPAEGDPIIDPNCPNDGTSLCHQFTYVSLLADSENTLHLVSRWLGRNLRQGCGYYRISYLRKPWNQPWEPRKVTELGEDLLDLVNPFRNFYSHWYHKQSIDRTGRLYLFYAYLGNNLKKDAADEYMMRWPGDDISPVSGCDPVMKTRCLYNNVRQHDPVVAGFDPSNDQWAILTTSDFAGGFSCDENTYPGAPEINDGLDNQCPGDLGYGIIDEITRVAGFFDPNDISEFSWPAQAGATQYQVVRSSDPTFPPDPSDCTFWLTSETFINDPEPLIPGSIFLYLVRSFTPFVGSWGQDSSRVERTEVCLIH